MQILHMIRSTICNVQSCSTNLCWKHNMKIFITSIPLISNCCSFERGSISEFLNNQFHGWQMITPRLYANQALQSSGYCAANVGPTLSWLKGHGVEGHLFRWRALQEGRLAKTNSLSLMGVLACYSPEPLRVAIWGLRKLLGWYYCRVRWGYFFRERGHLLIPHNFERSQFSKHLPTSCRLLLRIIHLTRLEPLRRTRYNCN